MKNMRLVLAAVALACLAAAPARAQLFGDVEQEVEALQQEVTNIKGALRDVQQRLIESEERNQNLAVQLTDFLRQQQELQQTIRDLKGDIEAATERQAEASAAEAQALRQQLVAAQNADRELRATAEALQGEVARLQEGYSALEEGRARLSENQLALTEQLAQRDEAADDGADAAEQRAIVDALTQQVFELEQVFDESIQALQSSHLALLESHQSAQESLLSDIADLKKQGEQINRFAALLPPEDEIYNDAFAQYRLGDYAVAAAKFMEVISLYPDGQFVVNAQYWLGQTHLKAGEFSQALEVAFALLGAHPDNARSAETLLTIAEAYIGLEDSAQADEQLRMIVGQYPTSLAADRARELLAR